MKMRNHFNVIAIIAAITFIGLTPACKKAPKKEAKAKGAPTMEAKQTIETPTLAPPPEKAKTAEEEKSTVVTPRGPITLPTQAGEETGAGPKPEAETPQKEPAAEGVPLESLAGKKEEPASAEESIKAMAAPNVKPSQEEESLKQAQPVQYAPKLVTAKTNIDVILDASGSMGAPFGATSQLKFDALRESLYDIVFEMVEQQAEYPRNIGIRLFGSKRPSQDNDCKDSELIVPMGEPALDGIKSLLGAAKPQGTSPIAFALSEAAKDFPDGLQADKIIVLVADGADNCNEDPCAAAEKIMSTPASPLINVVAFDVTPTEQEALQCIAKKGGGKLFVARNPSELRNALNDAINSSVPYNLKLTARAGATPLPFNLTVYKAGTQNAVKRDKSLGTKLLSLEPGVYDILIEYAASPEAKKPSKILKGVEIQQSTRVEQTVNFDLGQLVLSAISNEGKIVPARFEIISTSPGGDQNKTSAQVETGAEATSIFLTPGTYDINGNLLEVTAEGFSLTENGVQIKSGETAERVFRFQKGTLAIKGLTTQNDQIPFIFQAYKPGHEASPVVSGAFSMQGGSVYLVPGKYDILAIGTDARMIASPRTRVKGVDIKAGETTDLSVSFEMGQLKITAVDGKNNKVPAEFVIMDSEDEMEMARVKSQSGDEVSIPLPPGTYDIVAVSLKSTLEPRPSVPVPTIKITAKKPTVEVVKFILGTLRLRGRSAKELPIRTQFTIYRSGSDELISSASPTTDWVVFDLAPGHYDALATNDTALEKQNNMIWLRDLTVEDGKTISHEAIYTAGRLKIIGRGPNNKLITCKFKVFEYGADRELISGETGDDWEIFEIEPGSYYLEASYYDEEKTVTLKKWINIKIGDNEVVEQMLRF
jgi:Mg-chelatase subunit ChlD